MQRMIVLMAACAVLVFCPTLPAEELTEAEKADGWVSLFDGKTLDGWECNEKYNGFNVEDGAIVSSGKYCHLFYVKEKFGDFEFKADFKINKGGNGGLYIKVPAKKAGWPVAGFELQVNASHKDLVKTGSIYNIVRLFKSPHGDDEWFTYHLIARGKSLKVHVNGELLYEYIDRATDQDAPIPHSMHITEKNKRMEQEGYFAIQHHDPGSVGHVKNIKVKKLVK